MAQNWELLMPVEFRAGLFLDKSKLFMKQALMNWSGGKDSALALYQILQKAEYEVKYLLTSINETFERVSMHGVRVELLAKQAQSLGLPLQKLYLPEMASMDIYSQRMEEMMQKMRAEGIEYSIFGDIFLADLREYREKQLQKVSMQGIFPIWQRNSTQLIEEFIDVGFQAILVCVNEKYLPKEFVGRLIDQDFLKELPKNIDPCGENGEYHSFVFAGPIFKEKIDFEMGEIIYRNYSPISNQNDNTHSNTNWDTGFWYLDLK
jgi:uncharacterized protein (TIGR00290 family)